MVGERLRGGDRMVTRRVDWGAPCGWRKRFMAATPLRREARLDVIIYMAQRTPEADVQFMMVMATTMPDIRRG